MSLRELGKTGVKIPSIGLGCMVCYFKRKTITVMLEKIDVRKWESLKSGSARSRYTTISESGILEFDPSLVTIIKNQNYHATKLKYYQNRNVKLIFRGISVVVCSNSEGLDSGRSIIEFGISNFAARKLYTPLQLSKLNDNYDNLLL
ncbi:hypothetical protein RIR_jg12984.t1 [Rhizophagus irregularis DAOM 181602=DAOM 197198]|nr:hypothetical protein RIR_jg12984.t1 [Rhizophagus irregularis DAOM 181602=DAOM 197198]